MNLKKLILGSIITIIPCVSLNCQQQYTISGTVTCNGEGSIYVYLVDEEIAKIPFTGIQTIVLAPDESTNTLPFAFNNVEAGTYGIRCYQDRNKNGELDRGAFGPIEPWGMSWQGEKPQKWPKWNNFSFEVMKNISGITIVLNE